MVHFIFCFFSKFTLLALSWGWVWLDKKPWANLMHRSWRVQASLPHGYRGLQCVFWPMEHGMDGHQKTIQFHSINDIWFDILYIKCNVGQKNFQCPLIAVSFSWLWMWYCLDSRKIFKIISSLNNTTCEMSGYVFYKMFQSTTASHEIYPSFVQGAEWFPFIQGLSECSIFQWPWVNPRMGHLPETNMSHLEVDGSCWNPAYFSGANYLSFRECKLVAFSMQAGWAKEKMKFESLNCWSTTSKLCFMYPLRETNHKRHILLQILDILWHFRFLVFESCCFGDQSTYPWKSNHTKTTPTYLSQPGNQK